MALSPNMNIMKALIEECLRRRGAALSTTPRDIEVALQCLRIIIEEPEVYILSDSPRFTEAFAKAFDRPCKHLANMEDAFSIEKGAVIALHTGDRTDRQRARYGQMLEAFKGNTDIVVYHIGRWYV